MASTNRRFRRVRNEGFLCEHCGARVRPLANGSCRNHCSHCLWSRHVDELPGDRASRCGGMMECVDVQRDSRRGWMLVHKCTRCGVVRRNKAVLEDPVQPDEFQMLLRTMERRDRYVGE